MMSVTIVLLDSGAFHGHLAYFILVFMQEERVRFDAAAVDKVSDSGDMVTGGESLIFLQRVASACKPASVLCSPAVPDVG